LEACEAGRLEAVGLAGALCGAAGDSKAPVLVL
jgi:hypothetical protein